MSIIQTRIIYAAIFCVFTFLSGFWVMFSGKPINAIILAIHKLISLGAIVFLFIIINQINRVSPLSVNELSAAVVAGLFFLSTIVSGGLLATAKPMPAAILTMHRITPVLTLLSTAIILFMTFRRS